MLTVSDAKNVVNSGRLNSEIAIKLNCAITCCRKWSS